MVISDARSRGHVRCLVVTGVFVSFLWLFASAGFAQTGQSSPAQSSPVSAKPPAAEGSVVDRGRVDSTTVAYRWGTLEAQVRWRRQVTSRAGTTGTSDEGVSVGGLVVNETRTTIGRDFYSAFYTRWEVPAEAKNVTVRVREQPRPNLGTRVLVEVEGTTVFRATLQPDVNMVRRAARAALARTTRYLKKRYEPRNTY